LQARLQPPLWRGLVIDGRRVEWNDFGATLMAFEGWQFRLELLDPSDEA
jgi:hypothetical protein